MNPIFLSSPVDAKLALLPSYVGCVRIHIWWLQTGLVLGLPL